MTTPIHQLNFLAIFDLTKPPALTPYELHREMIAAMRHAFVMFHEEAVRIEPQLTGLQFPARLPDGRMMTVRIDIHDSA